MNFWKITILNWKITISPDRYRTLFRRYLLDSFHPDKWSEGWNKLQFLQLFALSSGIVYLYWSLYRDQLLFSLSEKNLPQLSILLEEQDWNTLKLLRKNSLNLQDVKRIDVYQNSMIVQPKKGVVTGSVLFEKQILSFDKIQADWLILPVFEFRGFGREQFYSQHYYYYLDEFPFYLQTLTGKRAQSSTDSQYLLNTFCEKKRKEPTLERDKVNLLLPPQMLMGEAPKVEMIGRSIQFEEFEKFEKFEKSEIKRKKVSLFFKKESIGGKKLSIVLQEKGFYLEKIPKLKLKKIRRLKLKKIRKLTTLRTLKKIRKRSSISIYHRLLNSKKVTVKKRISLLHSLNKKRQNQFLPTRKMSGFIYPDMRREQVQLLARKFFWKILSRNPSIRIHLSPVVRTRRTFSSVQRANQQLNLMFKYNISFSQQDLRYKRCIEFNNLVDSRNSFFGKLTDFPKRYNKRKGYKKQLINLTRLVIRYFVLYEDFKETYNNWYFFVQDNIFSEQIVLTEPREPLEEQKAPEPVQAKKAPESLYDPITWKKKKRPKIWKPIPVETPKPVEEIKGPLGPIWPNSLSEEEKLEVSTMPRARYLRIVDLANLINCTSFYPIPIHYHYHLHLKEDGWGRYLSQKSFLSRRSRRIPHVFKEKRSLTGFRPWDKLINNSYKKSYYLYENLEPLHSLSWLVIVSFAVLIYLINFAKIIYLDYVDELLEFGKQSAVYMGVDVNEMVDRIRREYRVEERGLGYRVIRRVPQRFKDIIGIEQILPQINEIIWFLRTSAREITYQYNRPNTPKGVLLIGPPGTGKTLLVKALAGESEVPVLIDSGSLLIGADQRGQAARRLKQMFTKARAVAPCIVFIDEIDTLGQKREQVLQSQSPSGIPDVIESIYQFSKFGYFFSEDFLPEPLNLLDLPPRNVDLNYEVYFGQEIDMTSVMNKFQRLRDKDRARLTALLQLLIELDGLFARDGIVVIGATNRPSELDPALTRPGRFDQIVTVDLPNKDKRKALFHLYSKDLPISKNISWEYLANRTRGFSPADLAMTMNESALKAISENTIHTLKTIEKGIDRITSYPTERGKVSIGFAYSQAGKAVLHTLLKYHSPAVVFHLWPREKNTRHSKEKIRFIPPPETRFQLESKLIGFLSGKAAELLFIYGNSDTAELRTLQSDSAHEDIKAATLLARRMVDKWYLYSKKVATAKYHQPLDENRNYFHFRQGQEYREAIYHLYQKRRDDQLELDLLSKLNNISKEQFLDPLFWWRGTTVRQVSEISSPVSEWYRFYLPDPEETLLNIDWFPPDEYFHANNCLKNSSPAEIYKIEKDYSYHNLILNCFNQAFSYLDENREFLDYFANYLLRYGILRQEKIEQVLDGVRQLDFGISQPGSPLDLNISSDQSHVIQKSWGEDSRRPFPEKIETLSKKATDPTGLINKSEVDSDPGLDRGSVE